MKIKRKENKALFAKRYPGYYTKLKSSRLKLAHQYEKKT